MSTICKLDRRVRLDRLLRKQQLRGLQEDVTRARDAAAKEDRFIRMIQDGNDRFPNEPPIKTPAAEFRRTQYLNLLKITTLTYEHIRKVCRDPRRTGAAKERILEKLGGAKE